MLLDLAGFVEPAGVAEVGCRESLREDHDAEADNERGRPPAAPRPVGDEAVLVDDLRPVERSEIHAQRLERDPTERIQPMRGEPVDTGTEARLEWDVSMDLPQRRRLEPSRRF